MVNALRRSRGEPSRDVLSERVENGDSMQRADVTLRGDSPPDCRVHTALRPAHAAAVRGRWGERSEGPHPRIRRPADARNRRWAPRSQAGPCWRRRVESVCTLRSGEERNKADRRARTGRKPVTAGLLGVVEKGRFWWHGHPARASRGHLGPGNKGLTRPRWPCHAWARRPCHVFQQPHRPT